MKQELKGLSIETLNTMTSGTRMLLEFTCNHIDELADVDIELFTRYYVKQRAELYQRQQEPHFISLACADIKRSRKFYYNNHLAGNL